MIHFQCSSHFHILLLKSHFLFCVKCQASLFLLYVITSVTVREDAFYDVPYYVSVIIFSLLFEVQIFSSSLYSQTPSIYVLEAAY